MRVGYLGPEGTFSHEALMASGAGAEAELVALPTIYDTVMAVHDASVDRALVPIENSLEGSVNPTLDTLAAETSEVRIVGELVHAIRHCLIARSRLELGEIEAVVAIPQASAQCARFIRSRLGGARVLAASSSAEAVRVVAEHDGRWAALGNRLSASIYEMAILREDVEDTPENETRFVWLARGADARRAGDGEAAWKTSIVFWGAGDDAPGWLVRCLSEFAFRGVNLTMIESRPRKRGLGHYMFFADLEGRETDPPVAQAIEAVRGQTEQLRVLGSYPAA
jgi:prephenate dehydratase